MRSWSPQRRSARAVAVLGLSVSLLWLTSGSVVQGQPGFPGRDEIVSRLQAAIGVHLVAGEGDVPDFERAAFYSDPVVRSVAFIPYHPASPSMAELAGLIEGGDTAVAVGVLTLETAWPGLPQFEAGTYTLKLGSNRSLIAVDSHGEEITIGSWQPTSVPEVVPEDDVFAYFSGLEYTTQVATSEGGIVTACPWCPVLVAVGTLLMGIGALSGGIAALIGVMRGAWMAGYGASHVSPAPQAVPTWHYALTP